MIFCSLCFPQKQTLDEVKKLNGHLMASHIKNIPTRNHPNLISGFQVTVKNVGNVFFETQCSYWTVA